MPRELLTDAQLSEALRALDGWTVEDGRLFRELQFDDFVRAFGFMCSVALVAQQMDHHPDWTNVYDRVSIHLHTHDRGGITGRDTDLAARIDALAAAGTSS
jgi:4a-hydroxytetrahydrobiopterin dehydratase